MKLIAESYKFTIVLLVLLIAVAYFAEWTDDFYGHCLTEGMHEPISKLQPSDHGGADPNFMKRMQSLSMSHPLGKNDSIMKSTENEDLDQEDSGTVLSTFGAYDRSTGIKVGNEYQSAFGASSTSESERSTGFGKTLKLNGGSKPSRYGKNVGGGYQF